MSSQSLLKSSVRLLRHSLAPAAMASAALVSSQASAEVPSVVTTIKPLHSIASAVMEGVGTPHILVDGASSPHGFALKPSQAAQLQEANAVFWVGPELAPSLAKPIESMASSAVTVELMEAAGIHHLDIREGTNFDNHDHDHGEEHEEAHGEHKGDEAHDEHAAHDDHDDDDHAHEDGHDHESEAGHGDDHGEHEHAEAHDPHIWLNPENGIAIAGIMAETLAELDPDNAATYRENAAKFTNRIENLEQDLKAELEPVSDKKFIVFHDAYHHFEHHFGIEASGSVTVSPEALSSADRVAEIQGRIKELEVVCVFQEPQFDAKLVDVVLEGSNARKATLDPLGTELANGPDLYPDLLKNLAGALSSCLNGQS